MLIVFIKVFKTEDGTGYVLLKVVTTREATLLLFVTSASCLYEKHVTRNGATVI